MLHIFLYSCHGVYIKYDVDPRSNLHKNSVWKNTLAVFLLLHHVSEPLLRDSYSKNYVRRADAHAASQNVSVMEAETTPCMVLFNSSTLENPFNGCDQ